MKKIKALFAGTAFLLATFLTSCTITNNLTHIEDQNGDEDTSLAVLQESDLVGKPRALTMMSIEKNKNGEHIFSCHTFSGVRILCSLNASSGEVKKLSVDAAIKSGNAMLYIIQDGKIVKNLEFKPEYEVSLTGLSGRLELRIAGESAEVDVKILELN